MNEVQPIALTDAAVEYINNLLKAKKNSQGFRLSVKKSGCSDFRYVPEIVDKQSVNDISFVTPQGLTVFVEKNSVSYLLGTVVDVVSEKLKQKRMVFRNPNEVHSCGCGESFSVD